MPSARIISRGITSSPMLKWSRLRSVCAPQYLSAETSISPIESDSRRTPGVVSFCSLASGDIGVLASVCSSAVVILNCESCWVECSSVGPGPILHHVSPGLNLTRSLSAPDGNLQQHLFRNRCLPMPEIPVYKVNHVYSSIALSPVKRAFQAFEDEKPGRCQLLSYLLRIPRSLPKDERSFWWWSAIRWFSGWSGFSWNRRATASSLPATVFPRSPEPRSFVRKLS